MTLRIGDPNTVWKGAIPFVLGVVGEITYLLPFTLLLVLMLDPLMGATVGKRVFGLRVRTADCRPGTRAQHWLRTAAKTVGLSGWTLALLIGRWELAVLATLAGGVALFGSLAALGRTSRALHDRLSGTTVCRSATP